MQEKIVLKGKKKEAMVKEAMVNVVRRLAKAGLTRDQISLKTNIPKHILFTWEIQKQIPRLKGEAIRKQHGTTVTPSERVITRKEQLTYSLITRVKREINAQNWGGIERLIKSLKEEIGVENLDQKRLLEFEAYVQEEVNKHVPKKQDKEPEI